MKILANSKERDLILRMEISMISQDHLDQVYIQKNLVMVNSVDLTMAHPDLKEILDQVDIKETLVVVKSVDLTLDQVDLMETLDNLDLLKTLAQVDMMGI